MRKIILGLAMVSSVTAYAQIPGISFPENSKTEISQTGALSYKEMGCLTFTEANTSSVILDQLRGFIKIKSMKNGTDMICEAQIQEFETDPGKFHVTGKVRRIRSGLSNLVNDVFEAGAIGIYNNRPNGTISFDLDSSGLVSNIVRNY